MARRAFAMSPNACKRNRKPQRNDKRRDPFWHAQIGGEGLEIEKQMGASNDNEGPTQPLV